jgi:hypothetical protein
MLIYAHPRSTPRVSASIYVGTYTNTARARVCIKVQVKILKRRRERKSIGQAASRDENLSAARPRCPSEFDEGGGGSLLHCL